MNDTPPLDWFLRATAADVVTAYAEDMSLHAVITDAVRRVRIHASAAEAEIVRLRGQLEAAEQHVVILQGLQAGPIREQP